MDDFESIYFLRFTSSLGSMPVKDIDEEEDNEIIKLRKAA